MNEDTIARIGLLSNLSRDVLCLILCADQTEGISGGRIRDRLGLPPAGGYDDRMACCLRNLREQGYINRGIPHRSTGWTAVCRDRALAALHAPERVQRSNELPWTRCIPTPPMGEPMPAGVRASEAATSIAPAAPEPSRPRAPRAKPHEPQHTGTAAWAAIALASSAALYRQTGPVIRAGALDALCLATRRGSRLFGTPAQGAAPTPAEVAQSLGATLA